MIVPIPIKSPDEIERMRHAGAILWRILDGLLHLCTIGTASAALGEAARSAIRAAGTEPILEGYTQHNAPPFAGAACICINEEAVHAPPSARILRAGDLVTIDIALRLDGWCADAARSIVVGGARGDSTVSPAPNHAAPRVPPGDSDGLLRATRRAVDAAIDAMRPGALWSEPALAMHRVAEAAGCRMVAGYAGHGIGRALHESPRAWSIQASSATPDPDFILRPGMVLTVEPILTLGDPATILLDDGWTVLIADRSAACHEERTVAITRNGPRVLTAP